jgi:hypothetical protein
MSIDLGRVTPQPYFASVLRAVERLKLLGQPLNSEDYEKLASLGETSNSRGLIDAESILAPYTTSYT